MTEVRPLDDDTVPLALPPVGGTDTQRHHGRRILIAGAALALVAAAATLAVTDPFSPGTTAGKGVTDNAFPTSLATVTRGTITSQTTADATLGYSGSYSIVNQAQGTFTSLPGVGQVVSQGQTLYDVNGSPIVLLYGTLPAYRALAESTSGTAMTGIDVQQLNTDLVALGYATTTEIPATSHTFTAATKAAVEALQAHLGVAESGTLALGQVVFSPTAVRITSLGAPTVLGGMAQPGQTIFDATSTTRVVTIQLDASEQSEVKVGDAVTITLPNNQTTPGTVSSVGTVATSSSTANDASNPGGSSTPTVTVLVNPSDPSATGTLDKAPVQVTITTATVPHALIVPINALLALAHGGYAVEVVAHDGVHSYVPVTLGVFDDADSRVQVSGPGLQPGQRVVVPST